MQCTGISTSLNNNPPTAKCQFEKSTNCWVLVRKIHYSQSACSNNPPTAECSIRKPTNYSVYGLSWWNLRNSISQLVGSTRVRYMRYKSHHLSKVQYIAEKNWCHFTMHALSYGSCSRSAVGSFDYASCFTGCISEGKEVLSIPPWLHFAPVVFVFKPE